MKDSASISEDLTAGKKPAWLKTRLPGHKNYFTLSGILKERGLNTICISARCPNIAECWEQKTAAFLILGGICTRNCAFCAVDHGVPSLPFPDEPRQIAETVDGLGLDYVVITSVTRDDLADGGASFFAETIRRVREKRPGARVEVLIPDFSGNSDSLGTVIQARPDLVNHNLETVEALYPLIRRPAENYRRSLTILRKAKEMDALTKSGMMLGLGEEKEQILQTLSDLRKAGCDLLTIGQYLRPERAAVPVRRYFSPQEFEQWKAIALDFGFKGVESEPLVRSSYHASRIYKAMLDVV